MNTSNIRTVDASRLIVDIAAVIFEGDNQAAGLWLDEVQEIVSEESFEKALKRAATDLYHYTHPSTNEEERE